MGAGVGAMGRLGPKAAVPGDRGTGMSLPLG